MNAAGFGGEVVAGERVGAGAGTAAEVAVLAEAALAFEQRAIAQNLEKRAVAVDLDQRIAPHVAGGERQEAAGIDLAGGAK